MGIELNCRKHSWCRRIGEQGECRKQSLTIPQRNSEEEQARDPLLGTLFIGHVFFQPNLGACSVPGSSSLRSLLQGLKCVFLFHPPPQPLNSVPTREGSTPTVLVGTISLPGAPLQPGAFPSPSPPPTGRHVLNSKGLHKACNQGSTGQQPLTPGLPPDCPQGPHFPDSADVS